MAEHVQEGTIPGMSVALFIFLRELCVYQVQCMYGLILEFGYTSTAGCFGPMATPGSMTGKPCVSCESSRSHCFWPVSNELTKLLLTTASSPGDDDGAEEEEQAEGEGEDYAAMSEEGELPATEEPEGTPPPPALGTPAAAAAPAERQAPATAPPAARAPAAGAGGKAAAANSAGPGVRTAARVREVQAAAAGEAAAGLGPGGGRRSIPPPGNAAQSAAGGQAGGSGAGAGGGSKRQHKPIVWPGNKEEKRVSGGGDAVEPVAGAPVVGAPPVPLGRGSMARSPTGAPGGLQQQRRGVPQPPPPGAIGGPARGMGPGAVGGPGRGIGPGIGQQPRRGGAAPGRLGNRPTGPRGRGNR